MEKKYTSLSILIFLILFILMSCSQIQEKPEFTADISLKEKGVEPDNVSESTTVSIKNPDLKKLQELENSFVVINVFPGISFKRPIEFQNAGDNSNRLFIAEQNGKIFVINNQNAEKAILRKMARI